MQHWIEFLRKLKYMSEKTFSDYDKFEREDFADDLTKIITTFYPFYDESFVLSLNAKYGSGKTTFLKMWREKLKKTHEVMYINAWKNDFDEEPLVSIIGSIISHINQSESPRKAVNTKFKKSLQAAMGATALGVTQVSEKLTGINAEKIIEKGKSQYNYGDLEQLGKSIYKEFSFKEKAYIELKKALNEYLNGLTNKPLFIFIDELDRVRPHFAIKFLEAIKHLFSVQGICFVIAVDKKQIENSTRHLYGNIDFKNYYSRFITREANLPDTSKINLKPHIQALSAEYFDEKRQLGVHFPFLANKQTEIINHIDIICRAHNFTGRETKTFFRIFSQYMAINSEQTYELSTWIRGAIYLLALSVYDNSLYKKFGSSDIGPDEIEQYIQQLNFNFPPNNSNKRYFIFEFLSCHIKLREVEEKTNIEHNALADIIIKYVPDIGGKDLPERRKQAIEYISRDSRSPFSNIREQSTFERIFINLEKWKTFID